ncbi:hypothetical protein BK658_17210 [Pseudomonas brassicacearum]|uniref:Uncharacterized protein n=1 Tax=Pseudomonas brassicacearum TaxID=930166 RepID=A0A423GNP3_9PSED|nr:hypothetical protein BK658_17210 [Pseudomonas brassicacearum]
MQGGDVNQLAMKGRTVSQVRQMLTTASLEAAFCRDFPPVKRFGRGSFRHDDFVASEVAMTLPTAMFEAGLLALASKFNVGKLIWLSVDRIKW